jgi:hypothetical protein
MSIDIASFEAPGAATKSLCKLQKLQLRASFEDKSIHKSTKKLKILC